MKNNFEIVNLVTGRPSHENFEQPIATSSETQRKLALGVAVVAVVLSAGVGPGMMLPISDRPRIHHKIAV